MQHIAQSSMRAAPAVHRCSAAPSPATTWQPSRRTLPPPTTSPRRRWVAAAAADRGDAEVAIFRFTLGNSDVDAQVPRIVGATCAALLVLNHVLSGEAASEAQLRAEALGAALATVACITPAIETRLKELQPGRGRQAAASSVAGAASVFALQPSLPEVTKQELAWASYALLLNTNICGLAVFWDGKAVLARGLLGAAALGPAAAAGTSAGGGGKGKASKGDAEALLAALSSSQPAAASSGWQQGPVYCPDRTAFGKAGANDWPCVPEGAETVLVQPLVPLGASVDASGPARGVLLLVSERQRALSSKERGWAAAVAAKLCSVLGSS